MACLNNELVDLLQQLRLKQRHVVFEGLKVVAHITESAVAQNLANAVVLVDQFMQPVVVAIQIEPDHAAHQDRPQGHAGAPNALAHLGCHLSLEQPEDCAAQRQVRVHELQAFQNLWDVIARFVVEAHLGDVDFTDGHLFVLDYAHGGLSWLENKANFGHPLLTFERRNGVPDDGHLKTIFCPKWAPIDGRRFR